MERPVIIVHDLNHAEAALEGAAAAGVSVMLRSAPGAAANLGAGLFLEIVAAAAEAHPDAEFDAVLDCGDAPGLALGALRKGVKAVRLHVRGDVLAKVADVAAQYGARVDAGEGPVLDLLDARNPGRAVREWLGLLPGSGESPNTDHV